MSPRTPAVRLGERLAALRGEVGWSIREAAERLGTSASQVQRLERAETSLPHPSTLHRAAQVFARAGARRPARSPARADAPVDAALYLELMELAGYIERAQL